MRQPSASGNAEAQRYMRARRDPALAVLEGLHALKHALRFGAEILDAASPRPAQVVAMAGQIAGDVAVAVRSLVRQVPPETFRAMAPRPHPTGVIALAARPRATAAAALDATGPAPVVLLDRPRHHGNTGAVVRVAAAAGAAGVLVTGEHDPWDPAAVRGAAGLHFALPVAALGPPRPAETSRTDTRAERDGGAELRPPDTGALDALLASRRPLVAIHPGGEPLRSGLVPPRAILALGSERHGLDPEILRRAAHVIGIPMRPGVSSLNLATAAAVVLYTPTTP